MSENDKVLSPERIEYFKNGISKSLDLIALNLKPFGQEDPNITLEKLKEEFEKEYLLHQEDYKILIKKKDSISHQKFINEKRDIFLFYLDKLGIYKD